MSVSTSDKISSSDYATVRANVVAVLNTSTSGSGRIPLSYAVSAGSVIQAQDWAYLAQDVAAVYAHTNNSTVSYTTAPVTGHVITAELVNSLATAAATARSNFVSSVLAPAAQLAGPVGTLATGTIAGGTLALEYTWTWQSSQGSHPQAWFFNLGGYFELQSLYTVGTPTTTADNQLVALINTVTPSQTVYDVARYRSGTYTKTFSDTHGNSIALVYSVTDTDYGLSVSITVTSASTLEVAGLVAYWYSTDTAAPAGIAAPVPSASTQQVAIQFVANVNSLSFTGYVNSTTNSATITLTNIGSQTGTIHTALVSNNGETASLLPNPNSAAILVPGGHSQQFSLSYATGASVGTFNNLVSFTVDSAPTLALGTTTVISIPTTTVISSTPFDFTISPSVVNTQCTTGQPLTQQFTITANMPYTDTYSASLSSAVLGTTGFTITSTDVVGPVIQWYPGNLTNHQTYTAVLSVTLMGITRTATINVDLELPDAQNLGTWVSAHAENNAVVGASYDIIATTAGSYRFLTLGFSVGADGTGDFNAGGAAYVDPANLNYLADPKYYPGNTVMYKSQRVGSSFFTQYGVGISWDGAGYGGGQGPNTVINRTFPFRVPADGNYYCQFNVVDKGSLSIDGSIVVDLSNATYDNYNGDPATATVQLNAGLHIVTLTMQGVQRGDYCSYAAARISDITDGTEYWSTLTPVRNTDYNAVGPYPYWGEVYRIPIRTDGTPEVLQSAGYYIKRPNFDIGPYTWGVCFGETGKDNEGSMFTITNDGYGNISLQINPLRTLLGSNGYNDTLRDSYDLFYYYDPGDHRITQLAQPNPDGTTTLFQGFYSNGSVWLSNNVALPTGPVAVGGGSVNDLPGQDHGGNGFFNGLFSINGLLQDLGSSLGSYLVHEPGIAYFLP